MKWQLPVVAETWDGYLNDINGEHVRPEHAVQAIEAAHGGAIAEGSVGGGTGMNCYGYKGGSGTASREVRHGGQTFHVGAFCQANFGDRRGAAHRRGCNSATSTVPDPIADATWWEHDVESGSSSWCRLGDRGRGDRRAVAARAVHSVG